MPSKWKATETGPAKHFIIHVDGDPRASIASTYVGRPESEATLLASAPELLAALEGCLVAGDNLAHYIRTGFPDNQERRFEEAKAVASAAIQKARGGKA